MPQQKFTELMPRAQLIFLGCFARAYQIPQRFVLRIRHPHRRPTRRRDNSAPASTHPGGRSSRDLQLSTAPTSALPQRNAALIFVSSQYNTYPVGPAL
jgi:hypothetical protein